MKKLTDPRLRKLTADAIAEAKRRQEAGMKDPSLRVPLDGQGGYLMAYPTGKTAITCRPRVNGKTIKLTYDGPPLTAAGVTKWLPSKREETARGVDPREERRTAKVAADLARRDSLRSVCESYLALQESRGQQRAIHVVRANLARLVFLTELAGRPVAEIRKSE